VSETYEHRIEAVTTADTTYAIGSKSCGSSGTLYYPAGIAVDKNGVVYVADNGNGLVKKISFSSSTDTTGTLATICAGYTFYDVSSVTIDSSLNLYVSSRYGNKVTKFVNACATSSTGTDIGVGTFGVVLQTAIDSIGNLFVADQSNWKIWRVDATSGAIVALRFADGAAVNQPAGIFVSSDRKIFISDFGTKKLKIFNMLDDTTLNPTLGGPYYPSTYYTAGGATLIKTASLGTVGQLPGRYTLSFRFKWLSTYSNSYLDIITLSSDQYAGNTNSAGKLAPSLCWSGTMHDWYVDYLLPASPYNGFVTTALPKSAWIAFTFTMDLINLRSTCTITPESATPIACASKTLISGYSSGFTNAYLFIGKSTATTADESKGLLSDIIVSTG